MNPIIQKAINDQIREELYSAYLYLSISAYFACGKFGGIAKWMQQQAKEEVGHAMRFFDYMHKQGGQVVLDKLKQPPSDFHSVLKAFEASLKHEKFITGRIHALKKLAEKEGDSAFGKLLDWYVEEQVEEEETFGEILKQIKTIKSESSPAMFTLDQALGKRESE